TSFARPLTSGEVPIVVVPSLNTIAPAGRTGFVGTEALSVTARPKIALLGDALRLGAIVVVVGMTGSIIVPFATPSASPAPPSTRWMVTESPTIVATEVTSARFDPVSL